MSTAEAPVRDEFFDELLGDFLDESSQLLDRLNENLLQLDEWVRSLDGEQAKCDADLMNEMFRAAHSIKGLSAMLGLGTINNLTHKIENVFDAARNDQLHFAPDSVEILFQSLDLLISLIECLRDSSQEEPDCTPVTDRIARLLQSAGVERQQTSQADAENALLDEFSETAARDEESASEGDDETSAADSDVGQPAPPDVDYFADVVDETEVPAKYLSIFIDEAELSLDSLSETLLSIETDGGPQATETLLITAHRIKGSAASVGLNRPAKLAHYMEDILQTLRASGDVPTPEVTDAMLKCTDALRTYVEGLRSGQHHRRRTARVLPGIRADDLPSVRHRENGRRERSARGRRRAAARVRHARAARGRLLDHADPRIGQHQRADRDGRREGVRHDPRGRARGRSRPQR
ncbi:MAG: Hpt domain-containing protein, partial [Planctomycetes bacterium]|nr:Hpt domain-containing protein [Planctomycetota bacterium]